MQLGKEKKNENIDRYKTKKQEKDTIQETKENKKKGGIHKREWKPK